MWTKFQSMFVLSVLFGILAPSAGAQTQLSWLNYTSSCERFSGYLIQHYGSLESFEQMCRVGIEESQLVLSVACGTRYRDCGFRFCNEQQAAVSVTGSESPTNYTRARFSSAIEKNPLRWLENEMNCEQLVEQIHVRYAPLGGYSGLPESKKLEVAQVLSVVCSDRFASCGFSACSTTAKKEEISDVGTSLDSRRSSPKTPRLDHKKAMELAKVRLGEIVRDQKRKQQQLISQSLIKERENSFAWAQLKNPDEARRIAKPRAERDIESQEQNEGQLPQTARLGEPAPEAAQRGRLRMGYSNETRDPFDSAKVSSHEDQDSNYELARNLDGKYRQPSAPSYNPDSSYDGGDYSLSGSHNSRGIVPHF